MADTEFCTITNTTKSKLPRLPFVSIKNYILGEEFNLSVGFISPTKQKKLNNLYRKINKTTNILSFPISKKEGQITFDLQKVKKDAPLFDMSYTKFLKFLFIHGCLHLKGFEHSSTMEKEEKRILNKFS